MNERIVALDIGDARIGVAVSDESRLIATPIDTIYRVGYGPDVRRVLEICKQHDTTQVLSGWPLNMDGTAGFQSAKVKAFCEQLEKAGLTVFYQDERLTTVTATNALIEGNMHRAERKHNVDKVAAAVILQQYLDTCRNAVQTAEIEESALGEEEPLVTLTAPDGSEVAFRFGAVVPYDGKEYAVLLELEDNPDGEEQVLITRLEPTDDGSMTFVVEEDSHAVEQVFNQYESLRTQEGEA